MWGWWNFKKPSSTYIHLWREYPSEKSSRSFRQAGAHLSFCWELLTFLKDKKYLPVVCHEFKISFLDQNNDQTTILRLVKIAMFYLGQAACRPPSTGSCAPVMKEASSEARKAMVWATSSAFPGRPSGCVWLLLSKNYNGILKMIHWNKKCARCKAPSSWGSN